MGERVRLGFTLMAIAAAVGLVLGAVERITAGPIAQVQESRRQEALRQALPEAESFAPADVPSGLPSDRVLGVERGFRGGEAVGYAITVSSKGYGGSMVMVVGLSLDGTVKGIRVLSHSETPGLGSKAAEAAFASQFEGKRVEVFKLVKSSPSSEGEVQAVSGATISSRAVLEGVNLALEVFRKL